MRIFVKANGGGMLINTDLSEIVGDIRLNNDAWIGGTGVVAHIWYDMNRSGYWMRVEPQEGAPSGKYKIMDWSGMDGSPSGNWISANGFTVQYDARKVKKAVLSVEDNAMYLNYEASQRSVGFLIIVR